MFNCAYLLNTPQRYYYFSVLPKLFPKDINILTFIGCLCRKHGYF
nr:MAG TPA: hypothetical protein [Caudoviricetes sp.]